MGRFREEKNRLLALSAAPGWKKALEDLLSEPGAAKEALNPLLALLIRPESRWQAAFGLGLAGALTARQDMESARVLMRRLMWSLNEESGNLGWGAPEAMGCILAESPALAGEYARILISYGYETGKDDNFLDHAPLRRGVYWGIGRLAQTNPGAAAPALPHLIAALGDEDGPIRGMACWALGQLAKHAPEAGFHGLDKEAWDKAEAALKAVENGARAGTGESDVELFDGEAIVLRGTAALAGEARGLIEKRRG